MTILNELKNQVLNFFEHVSLGGGLTSSLGMQWHNWTADKNVNFLGFAQTLKKNQTLRKIKVFIYTQKK